MTKSIGLMSTSELTDEDIKELVSSKIGTMNKCDVFPFQVVDKENYIRLTISPEELEHVVEDVDDPYNSDSAMEEKKLYLMLGGEPRTLVIIEVGRAEGSDALAYDFALGFGEHWPVVISDNVGNLFSLEDIRRRRDAGIEL